MKELGRVRRSDHGAFIIDRRGTILGFDQAMEFLTGWRAIDVVGRNKKVGLSVTGSPLYEGDVPMTTSAKNLNLSFHCRNGQRLEIEASTDRLSGPGDRVKITALRVVTRSPKNNPDAKSARFDELTGLPHAEQFYARVADEFESARTSAQPLALIVADVDRLRQINDRWGHNAGDDVLRRLAGILRVAVEDETLLCRLADDDFAVLMPQAGRGEARQLAAGLRSTVERYQFFSPGETEVGAQVTLSMGAASFPADAENAKDLMDRAHDALNEARSMGRNRVWCYLRRPRVPLEVPVFFDAAESLLVGYTRDLSPSGIFVQTAAPIEIGMRCALAFPLPGYSTRVHVIARVVRTVPTDFSAERRVVPTPGMGVEFERFSGTNDRRAIETFLHLNESNSLRPENGVLSS